MILGHFVKESLVNLWILVILAKNRQLPANRQPVRKNISSSRRRVEARKWKSVLWLAGMTPLGA